jgi:hypothetical protein
MAILNIENRSINTNVASSNTRVKFRIAQGQLTSDVLDEPVQLFEICEDGLIFYCPDNSMYIPLI